MTYEAKGEQQDVIESTAPVLVVLGGAGTGKTTTAVAAARRHLEDADERLLLRRRAAHQAGRRTRLPAPERVLFLSFSRTAVAQIIDRSSDVIGPLAPRLEVATFHGFAWRIINSFGPHHGYPPPLAVLSEAQRLVGGAGPGLAYNQLVPTAMALLGLDKVRNHYNARYGLVICDEFQDTDDQEWQFLQQIAPTARRILLGDTNQCIYAGFKHINADTRIATAMGLPGADKIMLPPLSYRDPSGTLPAAAEAAMRRDFTHDAIRTAATAGRISVTDYADGHGHAEVLDLARRARKDGDTVSIFTHTNVATSSLSDALLADGLVHEQVGLTEAHGEALAAQLALVKYALNLSDSAVLRALAVYVQATERKGNRVVPLAHQMLNPATNVPLSNALNRLARDLRASVGEGGQPDIARLAEVITNAYSTVGAARGQETWLQAARQTRIALHHADQSSFDAAAVEQELLRVRDEALVGAGTARRAPIQVMNLHQQRTGSRHHDPAPRKQRVPRLRRRALPNRLQTAVRRDDPSQEEGTSHRSQPGARSLGTSRRGPTVGPSTPPETQDLAKEFTGPSGSS